MAGVSGKSAYSACGQLGFPAVGDWLMTDRIDGNAANAAAYEEQSLNIIVPKDKNSKV